MRLLLSIEFNVDRRLIFVTREVGDARTFYSISVPDELDVSEEAINLYLVYDDDTAYDGWELELDELFGIDT